LGDPQGSRTTPAHAPRPPPEPNSIVVVLSGRIDRGDIPALCERIRELLQGDARPVVCDVGALVDPDAVTVDALARLQLTAGRLGHRVRLRGACGELQGLLLLMGLSEALPVGPELPIEPRGQAEEREQARGVEEEADPGDPAG
jgi:ABC-type transporter Mla MlaB component